MSSSRIVILSCGAGFLMALLGILAMLLGLGGIGLAVLGAFLPLLPLIGLASVVTLRTGPRAWFIKSLAATLLASVVAMPLLRPMALAASAIGPLLGLPSFTIWVPNLGAALLPEVAGILVICLLASALGGLPVRWLMRHRAA